LGKEVLISSAPLLGQITKRSLRKGSPKNRPRKKVVQKPKASEKLPPEVTPLMVQNECLQTLSNPPSQIFPSPTFSQKTDGRKKSRNLEKKALIKKTWLSQEKQLTKQFKKFFSTHVLRKPELLKPNAYDPEEEKKLVKKLEELREKNKENSQNTSSKRTDRLKAGM